VDVAKMTEPILMFICCPVIGMMEMFTVILDFSTLFLIDITFGGEEAQNLLRRALAGGRPSYH
jgi:hypothetical protein